MIKGIKVIGPVEELGSYGELARRLISCLWCLDIPLTIHSVELDHTKLGQDPLINKLQSNIDLDIDYNVVIAVLSPSIASDFLRKEDKSNLRVIYTHSSSVDTYKPWSLFINTYADCCWAPGDWNYNKIKDAIKVPTFLVPISVDKDELDLNMKIKLSSGGSDSINDSTFLFYTMGEWGEKTNFVDLLQAYWYTFSSDDNVCLLLKPYVKSTQEVQLISKLIDSQIEYGKFTKLPNIMILGETWPRKLMVGLHKKAHCYVSASRLETTPFNLLDAVFFGNQVIANNYGEVDYYLQDYYKYGFTERPLIGMLGPEYSPKSLWASPNFMELSSAMKSAFDSRDKVIEESNFNSKYIQDNFDKKVVANTVADYLKTSLSIKYDKK